MNDLLPERPDDPRLLTLAAEIALELGRSQDADRFLERALAMDPDRREALILQARMQLRQGHSREALSAAERLLRSIPTTPAALGLLGSIQATLGQKEQATRTMKSRQAVERRNQEIEGLLIEIREARTTWNCVAGSVAWPRRRAGRIWPSRAIRRLWHWLRIVSRRDRG